MKKYQNKGSIEGEYSPGGMTQQEQLALQYEMNLPKLYTAPQQRFADIAPIHNAQLKSEFTPNMTYSPYISKYLGDTVPLETGLLQLNDLNKQAYESIVPTVKVGDALEADYKYRDSLKEKYENSIKTISEDKNLSDRARLQKIKQLKTDFYNDEQRRAVETSLNNYKNLEAMMDKRIEKGEATEIEKNAMLQKYLNDYNSKNGIGEAPSASGRYNTFSGENLAKTQDLVKEINSMLSGWAADTYGSDSSIDYKDGLYIVTNKNGSKITSIKPEDIRGHLENMLVNNPLVMADLKQRATVNAVNQGDTSQENILNNFNKILSDTISFGTDKGSFISQEYSSGVGIKGNATARWQIDRAERQKKEAQRRGETVNLGINTNKSREKIPTTFDTSNPLYKKEKDKWVKEELEKLSKDGNLYTSSSTTGVPGFGSVSQKSQLDTRRTELEKQYDEKFGNPIKYAELLAKNDPIFKKLYLEEQARSAEKGSGSGTWGDNFEDSAYAERAIKRYANLRNNSQQRYDSGWTLPNAQTSNQKLQMITSGVLDKQLVGNESYGKWIQKNYKNITVTVNGNTRAATSPAEVYKHINPGSVVFSPYTNTYVVTTNGEDGSNKFSIPAEPSAQVEFKLFNDAYNANETGKITNSSINIGSSVYPVSIYPQIVQTQNGEQLEPYIALKGLKVGKNAFGVYYKLYEKAFPGAGADTYNHYANLAVQNNNMIPIEHAELLLRNQSTTLGNFTTNLDYSGDAKATRDYSNEY